MMLQAATFKPTWIEFHPITTRREGREETLLAIAKALSTLTGFNEADLLKQLEWCNGHNGMEALCTEEQSNRLRDEWQKAPIWQDGKGRQYIMFEGVRTQDYSYQTIDVARYVEFEPTGKYRNIDTLRKRIQRNSDMMELDYLEDSGEIENVDPITIQHLYH
jgi:hypothetical protein